MNIDVILLEGILKDDVLCGSLQGHINEQGRVEIKASGYLSVNLFVKRNTHQPSNHLSFSEKSIANMENIPDAVESSEQHDMAAAAYSQEHDIVKTAVESSEQHLHEPTIGLPQQEHNIVKNEVESSQANGKEDCDYFAIPDWVPLENQKDFFHSSVELMKKFGKMFSQREFNIQGNKIICIEDPSNIMMSPPNLRTGEVEITPKPLVEIKEKIGMTLFSDKSTGTQDTCIEIEDSYVDTNISLKKIAAHYKMEWKKDGLVTLLPSRNGSGSYYCEIPEDIARYSYEKELSIRQMIMHSLFENNIARQIHAKYAIPLE